MRKVKEVSLSEAQKLVASGHAPLIQNNVPMLSFDIYLKPKSKSGQMYLSRIAYEDMVKLRAQDNGTIADLMQQLTRLNQLIFGELCEFLVEGTKHNNHKGEK